MDELYILGCLFLVFALLVAPVLAVIGFNRSSAAQQEIVRLRQRIEALEQRGAADNAPEPVQPAAPVAGACSGGSGRFFARRSLAPRAACY